MRMKRLGASCSTTPADCSRNTNGPDEPSMIGTSGADSSTSRLSIPSPARADIRCSTVWTLAPSRASPVHRVVSHTNSPEAGISTTGSRSTRRNTMPVSGAAGRIVRKTLSPLCRPTPVARITFLMVRCCGICKPVTVRDIPEMGTTLRIITRTAEPVASGRVPPPLSGGPGGPPNEPPGAVSGTASGPARPACGKPGDRALPPRNPWPDAGRGTSPALAPASRRQSAWRRRKAGMSR